MYRNQSAGLLVVFVALLASSDPAGATRLKSSFHRKTKFRRAPTGRQHIVSDVPRVHFSLAKNSGRDVQITFSGDKPLFEGWSTTRTKSGGAFFGLGRLLGFGSFTIVDTLTSPNGDTFTITSANGSDRMSLEATVSGEQRHHAQLERMTIIRLANDLLKPVAAEFIRQAEPSDEDEDW